VRESTSEQTTEGIRITAHAWFSIGDSNPDLGHFLFKYKIRVENVGTEAAQLMTRHWIVLDAEHRRHDVRGEGVVGRQPRLEPGEHFEYTSSVPLETTWGTMEGSYQMKRDDDRTFDAAIGRFLLMPQAVEAG
jgi:ApaG protein